MRRLSDSILLQAWERGQSQHPLDRALNLLALACPEKTGEELVSLSIGQRDAYLLTLRELTFGSKIDSFVECPNCQEKLEFSLNTQELLSSNTTESMEQNYTLKVEDFELKFRLPNSQDLAALVGIENEDRARSLLAQRCLLQINYQGNSRDFPELPAALIAKLTEQMAECDPLAEILIGLNCAACNHQWQALFDIVTFFWSELSARAKQLLRDVHVLARFYGWWESDILAMGPFRRQQYLDLIPHD